LDGSKRAQNEQIFRAANERLKDRLADLEIEGMVPFVCECGDSDCLQTVELSLAQFDAIRVHGSRFFMLTGHEDLSTEDVIEQRDGYVITEKEAGADA
jgi:hypothetical protein